MESKKSVAEVAQRLREIEDYNLAFRLQEEEYLRHYHRNREGRRLVGDDTKQSVAEQAMEDEAARQKRLETIRKITESDEELARRLQQQLEEEERQRLEELARRDAELARRLACIEEQSTSTPSTSLSPAHPIFENQSYLIPHTDLSETMDRTSTTQPAQSDVLQTLSNTTPASSTSYRSTDSSANVHQVPPVSLHPTNPFLQDLSEKPQTPEPTQYYSEFGLPPPSDLALGKRH